MNRDDLRKGGRFIKRTDPIRDSLSISAFSLAEICEQPTTFLDNPDKSIAHRSLHDRETFERGLKPTFEIIKKFEIENKRPVLRPINFTDDWKRQRQRFQKRGKVDEEEEFELEMEYLENKSAKSGPMKTATSDASHPREEVVKQVEDDIVAQILAQAEADAAAKGDDESHFKIKEPIEAPPQPETNAVQEEPALEPTSEVSRFIAMDTKPTAQAENVEAKAVKVYQDQLVDRAKAVEEAKAKGYQDGFKHGEEKAALQTRSALSSMTTELNAALNELQGLKKNILVSAQENFLVLCKTMMESLLRKEFAVRPESFLQLVNRAIKEALPDDVFRLRLHPTTIKNLSGHIGDDLKGKIVADETINPGEFRLESKMTVVDGNIKQLVDELLEQADLQLFDSEDKAS